MKYYIVFSTEELKHPFRNGWVEVEAPSIDCADTVFSAFFPDYVQPFSAIYPAQTFEQTEMFKKGVGGHKSHGKITVKWTYPRQEATA